MTQADRTGHGSVKVRGDAVYSVLIVDDHELFSTSLRMALRGHGVDAHQVAPRGRDGILGSAAELTPGLVVLDLELGRGDDGSLLHGSELVAELKSTGWQVLIVSGSLDQADTAAAIAAGAVGAVPKSSSFETLLETVLAAASGKPVMNEMDHQKWIAMHRACRAAENELNRRLDQLSRRERQVLDLLAEGHRAAAIAERFVVSMTTVRTQIRSILARAPRARRPTPPSDAARGRVAA